MMLTKFYKIVFYLVWFFFLEYIKFKNYNYYSNILMIIILNF